MQSRGAVLALQPPNRFCGVIKRTTDLENLRFGLSSARPMETASVSILLRSSVRLTYSLASPKDSGPITFRSQSVFWNKKDFGDHWRRAPGTRETPPVVLHP